MKNNIYLFFLLVSTILYGQDSLKIQKLTLNESINISKQQSIYFLTAKNNLDLGQLGFQSFRSEFLPSIYVNGILPNYTRSINRITADDGTDIFINQNQAFSSFSLEINQAVTFTGGQLSISSSLNRIDVFNSPSFTNYSSTPLTIQYYHESLLFNPYKWQKKIEPLLYQESLSIFQEELEQIALNTASLYFDFLLADVKSRNADINESSQDTIYKISKGRFEIGKIYENDLLQAELSMLNAKEEKLKSKNDLKLAKQAFLDQLGVKGNPNYELVTPEEVSFIVIDSTLMIEKALANRNILTKQTRRILESEREIAKINSDDIKIGITGNFGLTQQDEFLNQAYSNLLSQQNLSISFSAPLFTSGKRKADKKIAEGQLELIKNENAQELLNTKRELSLKYLQWSQLEFSYTIAKKASLIAQKRYDSSKRRFAIGKVSITDLNIAQKEKDEALYNYYQSLREYWELYYEIRRLTLFDFQKGQDIYQD